MADELILVLDAGTGGGRAVAVDMSGKVRARSYCAWDYFEPPGLEMMGKEFKPEEFEKIIAERCREVVAEVGADSIKGVTTTGMRQGCVFLDKEGKSIYGGPNRDVRGIQYSMEMEELLGEERTQKITGRWPPWMFAPSRVYWFRQDNKETADRIAKILMINDWLIHWLAGEAVSEPTNAAESLLFDVDKRTWSDELLSVAEIDKELMPRLEPCGTVVGEITKQASKTTGISPGVKVITGMADTQAGLLAGKVIEPGHTGIVAGSTAPVMVVMDESKRDPDGRLWIGCHPFPGLWLAESNVGDAGLIYRWYVEGHLGALAGADSRLYEAVEEMAEDPGPGSYGARAFLGPMIWDLKSMTPSVKAGIFLGYPVGDENAGPGNFARAILENIAFAIRANLDQAARVAGAPARVSLSGGMTRSALFCSIVAGTLGREVEVVTESEATAVGCAIAGFAALSAYPDMKTAAREMTASLTRTVEPDEDDEEEYNDLFEQWMEQYPAMMGLDQDDDD
jgi:sugar (pentulose or hexulose) kinase